MLVADAGAQSVRHQIHEGQAAAAGQEQEGHGQTQEVRLQQEGVLRGGEGDAALGWRRVGLFSGYGERKEDDL